MAGAHAWAQHPPQDTGASPCCSLPACLPSPGRGAPPGTRGEGPGAEAGESAGRDRRAAAGSGGGGCSSPAGSGGDGRRRRQERGGRSSGSVVPVRGCRPPAAPHLPTLPPPPCAPQREERGPGGWGGVRRSRREKIQHESTQPRLGAEAPPWRPAQCARAPRREARPGPRRLGPPRPPSPGSPARCVLLPRASARPLERRTRGLR